MVPARPLLDKAIIACRADDVAEIASLGRTLTVTATSPADRSSRPKTARHRLQGGAGGTSSHLLKEESSLSSQEDPAFA